MVSITNSLVEEAVFIDTSAFIEIWTGNRNANAFNTFLISDKIPRYIHAGIIYETHRRILFDVNEDSAFKFLINVYSGNINIIKVIDSDSNQARSIIKKYWSLKLTYCDAISFAVMQRLGIYKAFSYDKNHFWATGFIIVPY